MTKYKAVPLAKMKDVYPSLAPMEILAVILVGNVFYYVVETREFNYFSKLPKELRRHVLTADKVAYLQKGASSYTSTIALKSTYFKKKLIVYED